MSVTHKRLWGAPKRRSEDREKRHYLPLEATGEGARVQPTGEMLRDVKSFSHLSTTSSSTSSPPTSHSRKKKFGATRTTRKNHVLKTARGALVGTQVLDTKSYQPLYTLYARLRYALPPTGARRWRRPEPLPSDWIFSESNKSPRIYQKFGDICPQIDPESVAVDLSGWQETVEHGMNEDCLFLNIWVPAGVSEPASGWPVLFTHANSTLEHGHGMQQNYLDPVDLFRERTSDPHIIVSANFRVGIFGFLAGRDLMEDGFDQKTHVSYSAGNFGLWDLRMALQWTYDHVHLFHGNPNNITAGGSGLLASLLLHFDAFQLPDDRIIRRIIILSGAVAVQPDVAYSSKRCRQFDEICDALMIDKYLPARDKVRLLRNVPAEKLLEVIRTLEAVFSPVTDGSGGFIPTWLMPSIWNGELGRRLLHRKVIVIIGDASDERSFYDHSGQRDSRFRVARSITTREGLINKLKVHIPGDICQELVNRNIRNLEDWNSVYCDIMADMHCHAAVRGFAHSLFRGGMSTQEVLRYHIAWRSTGLDDWIDPGTGISHVVDVPIWWSSGGRAGLSKKDKHDVLVFTGPVARFVRGLAHSRLGWGTEAESEVRLLAAEGGVLVAEDALWTSKLEVWKVIRDTQQARTAGNGAHAHGENNIGVAVI